MSAYQALYRKYRPQTFDDVSGQMAVTQTLKTQIMTGKMSHAYLFAPGARARPAALRFWRRRSTA